MTSYALQRVDGREIVIKPIDQEAYEAALASMAAPRPPPAAAVVEAADASSTPDVLLRVLVDIPTFVDSHENGTTRVRPLPPRRRTSSPWK